MEKRKISLIIIAIAMALCMALFLILPACSGGGETETPPVTEDSSGGDEEPNDGDGSEEHVSHSYTVLMSDSTGHWYECECGEKDDTSFAEHDSTNEDGTTAYDSDGSQHWEACAVCGYMLSEKENCTTEETSYQSDRNSHWHTCKVCGGHVDEGAHNTNGDNGACSICGYVREELTSTTVYMVGDSTMCSFNDTTYYYPRYGYGTQLGNYLDSKATINNLALSGRSSISFKSDTEHNNYQQMVDGLSEGDYLIIGFGHNDEKYDDATRFTSPELDAVETVGSFQNSLYYNYIKVAQDAGATPILCTPIVRANKNDTYTGSDGHVVSGYGDYSACIMDLAEDYNITCIDLTTLTANLYTQIGYDEAIYYHAWTTSNSASVDTTHLNVYGAHEVSYLFASALAETNCGLGDYVLANIVEPIKDDVLKVNDAYVERGYEAPDFTSDEWSGYSLGTYLDVDWYKTTFGNTGTSSPYGSSGGYVGSLDGTSGTFTVGHSLTKESKDNETDETTIEPNYKGGFGSTDGSAYVFTQLAGKQNFKIEADVTVTTANASETTGTASTTQAGFGIMLRDDIYAPTSDNNNNAGSSILSNYVAAGMYNSSSGTNIIYSRENASISTSKQSVSTYFAAGDTAKITMERFGGAQNTTCTIEYKGQTYTYSYYDFDYCASDYAYTYLCFYAARCTIVDFTNVTLTVGEIANA